VLTIPPRGLASPLYWASAAVAIVIVAAGCAAWSRSAARRTSVGPSAPDTRLGDTTTEHALPLAVLMPAAVGGALVTAGFVIVALTRQAAMAWTIALPLLALAVPPLGARLGAALHDGRFGREQPQRLLHVLNRPQWLVILLALMPTLALLALSLHSSVLNPRAFQIFASFLLIVAAAGTWQLARNRVLRLPLAITLVVLHLATVEHWRHYPSEARDYRALAERMNERMRPGDLVFVNPAEHSITPLYYYLDGRGYTYVPADFAAATARRPEARVWLVYIDSYRWGPLALPTEQMRAALEGFRLQQEVTALRARAELYGPATD
jgi:hypothetical protein